MGHEQLGSFLECIRDSFMVQGLERPSMHEAELDLLFNSKEGSSGEGGNQK